MLDQVISYAYTFFKLFIGFAVIVGYLKISNKSHTTQLTPIDFIGNFILGGIIGGVIYNHDISLTKYLLTLFLAVSLISLLNLISTKVMFARRVVMSTTIPIIINGKLQLDSISHQDTKFDLISFVAKLRSKGIFSLAEVEFAQIEANGELTVIKKGEGHLNYLFVKSGQLLTSQLANANKSEEWLLAQLAELNLDLRDIFLVEFVHNSQLYIIKNDSTVVSKKIGNENLG